MAAAPEDRELQGIYADALLEEGGEHALRGELVQLTLARSTVKTRSRIEHVRASLDQALRARGLVNLQYAGGFMRCWACTSEELAAKASEVFADHPLMCELDLRLGPRDGVGQIEILAATAQLARVRQLTIRGHQVRSGRPTQQGLARLLASRYWPKKLEALRLPNCAIGDGGARVLAASASLAALRELDLFQNDVMSKGVIAIANSPHLTELRWLRLQSNKPGISGINAIAQSRYLNHLEYINTSKTWLNSREVSVLKKRFPALDLIHNPS